MSSATHQAVLNQALFGDQDIPTQMGFFSFPQNLTYSNPSAACQLPQKSFTMSSSSPVATATDAACITEALLPSGVSKQSADITSNLLGTQFLSLQRSSANLWIWGDVNECMSNRKSVMDNHLGVSALKMKKIKSRKKVREPRFCFKTMSDVDVLDDGYKWRKYGQKVVKNTQHPRSYYRCTQDNCRVKKRIERLAEDPRMVITTYEGRHVHSPSRDMEDTENQSQLNNFFW